MSFGSFFGDVGRGISGAANTIGHGLSSIAKPALGMASSLAPMAGMGLGGMLGGPGGAMMGSQLGSMFGSIGNSIAGGKPQSGGAPGGMQMPGMPSGMPSTSQLGSWMQNYIPPQYQQYLNQPISQLGQQFSGGLNSYLPGSGQMFNNMMSMVPQQYLNSKISDYFPQSQNPSNPGLNTQTGGY